MGLYIDAANSMRLIAEKMLEIPFRQITTPPPKGEVYLCLTAPFNTLLIVTDKREMKRLTQRQDGWKPLATYVIHIDHIKQYIDPKAITYGQK